MKSLGRNVVESTKEENIFKHIDYYVDGITYDVKADKNSLIWVEMKNVNGKKGWLCSEVQKIAFEIGNCFHIVDRAKLEKLVRQEITDMNIYDKPDYKKMYSRKNTKDLITYFKYDDIKNLVEEII